MNFLSRTTHTVVSHLPNVPESELHKDMQPTSKPATTLEGLIAEDPFLNSPTSEDGDKDSNGTGDVSEVSEDPCSKSQVAIGTHSDVSEDEGWIAIPSMELPDSWNDASDIHQLRSLDRSFVFPGEQIHILVCLSASKQDAEIITPFRVAAVMSKNGSPTQNGKQKIEITRKKSNSVSGEGDTNFISDATAGLSREENGRTVTTSEQIDPGHDVSATKTFLRMENHKQQTETLLERFSNSNFFVRFAGLDEPLWSKRSAIEQASMVSEMEQKNVQSNDGGPRQTSMTNLLNAAVESGSFDGRTSGGVARNTVTCYSLNNGDIVVLLQVNVGISNIKDPVLEVLQFERYQPDYLASFNSDHFLSTDLEDPCRELLSWLLPLDRALPPRPLSPPVGSTPGLGSGHQRSSSSASGSQMFSFSHFRSYSMPSLPQMTAPSTSTVPPSPKPAVDLEDVDRFSPEKLMTSQDTGNEGLLSFRGVSLEPERFSVHCGLEGLYLPGRRWRRKLEIVQPIEIHSFSTERINEDLICVQVKNVSPAHLPDIVIYLDAIAIVFEEASKGGTPSPLPIASIESGNGHGLPNLALRRGEEHSFILKPAITTGRDLKSHGRTNSPSHSHIGAAASNTQPISTLSEGTRASTSANQFAVLVSCRCNYTESKLFFKQPTSWRPRIASDLMISVASQPTEQTIGPNGRVSRLPVQVLTLQASNFTSQDLTLTVLAPISSTAPPSIVPLNSVPSSPISPFAGFPEIMGRVGGDKRGMNMQRLSSMPAVTESQKESSGGGIRSFSLGQRTGTTPDIVSSTDLGCTHLWLQSTVPLGCVPSRSSATVKLELLPLTDGIITLDTLQLEVKEKGMTYKPERPLKISATSSISMGIM